MNPKASIVLPTLDGEQDLARLLPALARQELAGGHELLAVDSSSTDASPRLLEEAGADVVRIKRVNFQHGRTRNERARAARGEFLVFLSQDALPLDEHWLANLIAAFDDPRVVGAYSRILPHPEDDPLTRRTALQQPEAGEQPIECDLDGSPPLDELAPGERARLTRFNNVSSAIRRSVFAQLPFPELAFGEDSAWAERALSAGHRIRFVPGSVVLHAHRHGPRSAFRRYRIDAVFQREVHGHRLRPGLTSLARGFLHEVREDARFALGEGRGAAWHLWRSPFLRGAQVLGQFLGSR